MIEAIDGSTFACPFVPVIGGDGGRKLDVIRRCAPCLAAGVTHQAIGQLVSM
jgi:hypothetical protein